MCVLLIATWRVCVCREDRQTDRHTHTHSHSPTHSLTHTHCSTTVHQPILTLTSVPPLPQRPLPLTLFLFLETKQPPISRLLLLWRIYQHWSHTKGGAGCGVCVCVAAQSSATLNDHRFRPLLWTASRTPTNFRARLAAGDWRDQPGASAAAADAAALGCGPHSFVCVCVWARVCGYVCARRARSDPLGAAHRNTHTHTTLGRGGRQKYLRARRETRPRPSDRSEGREREEEDEVEEEEEEEEEEEVEKEEE